MDKSPDAYRTIGEVAEALKLPQHVLRFWETRFPQVKPMKRGGNRRFYRPEDVELLRAVRILLYEDGYTIKGVQRILREQGPRAVTGLVVKGTRPGMPPEKPNDGAVPFARQDLASSASIGAQDFEESVMDEPPDRGPAPVAQPPRHRPDQRHSPDLKARPPSSGSLGEALEAVLAELLECERILASARE